ncbi:MAG: c-type cytochrome domain-containing protein, partial [Planctomycetia bacterium]
MSRCDAVIWMAQRTIQPMIHVPRPLRAWAAWSVLAALAAAGSRPAIAADARAFLTQTCIDCHGPDTQEGGVRFDTLPLDAKGLAASPDAIHSLIRAHES